jgi:hypothetical protein
MAPWARLRDPALAMIKTWHSAGGCYCPELAKCASTGGQIEDEIGVDPKDSATLGASAAGRKQVSSDN